MRVVQGMDAGLYQKLKPLLADGLRLDAETERRRNLRPRGGNRVIIAGFGRFGQITGRLLLSSGVKMV